MTCYHTLLMPVEDIPRFK